MSKKEQDIKHLAFLFWLLIIITYLFTKLPWLGESEGIFDRRDKLPPAHLLIMQGGGFILSLLIAERQARLLSIPVFIVFWFNPTGNGI